jgi:hypothetical protein
MLRSFKHTAALAACSFLLAAPPPGWFMSGSKPTDYDANVDPQTVYNNRPSVVMTSKSPEINGFGTLMQSFSAEKYLKQRVRFSAFVKSSEVKNMAGLWMRVDGSGEAHKVLAFDDMQDRPIKGNTGWTNYEVVLDVPEGATGISFGILLGGTGTVWMNSANFEVVGTGVPTTGHMPHLHDGPTNLTFEK